MKLSTRIDKRTVLPMLACAFALIVSPLLILATSGDFQALDARPENRVFWPAMALISVAVAVQSRSRHSKPGWPPHIVCLVAYLALAGASVLWAFSPERSLVRFVQQAMIATSIIVPAMLAVRTTDMMRGLYLCFTLSLILNLVFVMNGSVTVVSYGSKLVNIGYEGYFGGKNYLGECAAVGLLLSLHELLFRGLRRILGTFVGALAVALLLWSDSKTAFGLAIFCPILAQLTLSLRRATRFSPAVILLSIPVFYALLSNVSHINMDRLAYLLYGDSTLTGRTIIWDFARYEIGRKPLLGWGYQSFWLVPNAPSILDAPGWVKMMPNAHNGYYDTMLEMGYIGLALLLVFILSTLHCVGRLADRDPARAWLVLSLALFVICYNYFESLWMRGFEFLWVVFLILAAEVGRYWQTTPARRAAYGRGSSGPGHGRPTRLAPRGVPGPLARPRSPPVAPSGVPGGDLKAGLSPRTAQSEVAQAASGAGPSHPADGVSGILSRRSRPA